MVLERAEVHAIVHRLPFRVGILDLRVALGDQGDLEVLEVLGVHYLLIGLVALQVLAVLLVRVTLLELVVRETLSVLWALGGQVNQKGLKMGQVDLEAEADTWAS